MNMRKGFTHTLKLGSHRYFPTRVGQIDLDSEKRNEREKVDVVVDFDCLCFIMIFLERGRVARVMMFFGLAIMCFISIFRLMGFCFLCQCHPGFIRF